MRKIFTLAIAAATVLSLAACKPADKSVRSEAFQSDLTGGQVQWLYWPGKKGSVALWLVPVEGQEPVITLTCDKGARKMNVRGYMFSNYPGSNGPVMFMRLEGGGVNLRSRMSWAPTGDTPIARFDVRVKKEDLDALAMADKITVAVDDETHVFNGLGETGKHFPVACITALGAS